MTFPVDPPDHGGQGEPAPPDEQLPSPEPSPPDTGAGPALSAETPAAPGPEPRPGPGLFSSGEKIGSLLDVVLTAPAPDPKTRAAVAAIKTAQRFRLLGPVLDIFPALEDAEAWDQWIAVAVGVALTLVSDGVEFDPDELRRVGAQVLDQLYADVEQERAGGA